MPCATGKRVPLEARPVTRRFPAWKVPQPRSTPSRAKRQAVPEENASRVLPRALRKTSPASADDMASDFLPCLGTSCGRRERVHTTPLPRRNSLWNLPSAPRLTGGAGPRGCRFCGLGGTRGQAPLWDRPVRLPGQSPACTGADPVLRPGVAIFNKYRASL